MLSPAAVVCPLPAGGCTVHHNRTMHYAGPNTSDQPRRAYILGFGMPAKKRAQPLDFYWNRTKQTPREQRAVAAARRADASAAAAAAAAAAEERP